MSKAGLIDLFGGPRRGIYRSTCCFHVSTVKRVISTQVNLVKEEKLRRYQHKHAKSAQAKVAKLWEKKC